MTSDQKQVLDILNNMNTRNSKMLASFVEFCFKFPQARFWQALSSWSGWPFILVAKYNTRWPPESEVYDLGSILDTYYWEEIPDPKQDYPLRK